jgi:hypothetical protein
MVNKSKHTFICFESKEKYSMKKLLVTTAMLIGLAASSAMADDAAKKNQTVDFNYSEDLATNHWSQTTATPKFGFSYQYAWDNGLFLGFNLGTSQKDFGVGKITTTSNTTANWYSGQIDQNEEIKGGYKYGLGNVWAPLANVSVTGAAGVGYRQTSTADYPYFALYASADYKINDKWTWNAIGYRYRTAFDEQTYGWETHQISTGVTYNINDSYSVYGKVYRVYPNNWANVNNDGAQIGVKVNF